MRRAEEACERARAKVNLTLLVTGRRADGYHLLDSLVVFADAGDLLRAEPAATLSLEITGPQAAGLRDAPDNLVLRAARALAAQAGRDLGARITLEKHLPVASGIGGGSADAAAALRLLARLWRLDLAPSELLRLAAGLGADVPVCLGGRPARMRGIGEVLDPAPALPPCGLVLVNPGLALATPEVFGARAAPFSAGAELPDAWLDAATMAAGLQAFPNDLEPPAVAICPPVAEVLAALRAQPDCLLARMSGSGATCFGLFPDAAGAERVGGKLGRPGWWQWGGAMAA